MFKYCRLFRFIMIFPVRIVLGLLFTITGALKFPDFKGFAVVVASYGLLPRTLVKPAAYTQPFIEFLVGIWLLSGWKLTHAALAGLGLMIIANIFVISALVRKKRMNDCGCYGVAFKVPLSWKKAFENFAWTLLLIYLVIATL